MSQELKSSHAYIDELYSDLNASKNPSTEQKAELELRERELLELKQKYSHIGEKYRTLISETHRFQMDSIAKQKKIDQLMSTFGNTKDHNIISTAQESRANHGGKSFAFMQNELKTRQVASPLDQNDENAGKQLYRIATVKAAGGRKGLSEQYKKVRARQFGDKMHNMGIGR